MPLINYSKAFEKFVAFLKKLKPRFSWDETFMAIAIIMGWRTHCIRYEVGAVIVDGDNNIVSTGYNGPARGDTHCDDEGCAKDNNKPCRGTHAEMNCGNNARGNLRDIAKLWGKLTLYCVYSPCLECARHIVNAGITNVVFLIEYTKDKEEGATAYLRDNRVQVAQLVPLKGRKTP